MVDGFSNWSTGRIEIVTEIMQNQKFILRFQKQKVNSKTLLNFSSLTQSVTGQENARVSLNSEELRVTVVRIP